MLTMTREEGQTIVTTRPVKAKTKSKAKLKVVSAKGHTAPTAQAHYSRELDRHPVMSHSEQVEIGEGISLHRKTIQDLAMAAHISVRRRNVPDELMEPIRQLSKNDGFSVMELEAATSSLSSMLSYLPDELHAALLEIHAQLARAQGEYANLIDRMVSGNMRLVLRSVQEHAFDGTTREDLIQDGNLGLIKAAERYNPVRCTTFSTYAKHWISQCMQRSLNTTRAISYPVEYLDDSRQVRNAAEHLSRKLDRTPTDAEIAMYINQEIKRKLELSLGRPAKQKELDVKCRWHADKVKEFRTCNVISLSLQDQIIDGDDNESTIQEMVSNRTTPNPEQLYEREQGSRLITEALSVLSDTERTILCYFTGFGAEELSMTEITEKLGMTRDKVHRLHLRALTKMKNIMRERGIDRQALSALMSGD